MDNVSRHNVYEFGEFRLDVDRLMLYRNELAISLQPKVLKTLNVLVKNQGEILAKEELIALVWEGSIVEESNLTQHLYLLRKTLGNLTDGRPYIETLRRRGYRFNGEVKMVSSAGRPDDNDRIIASRSPHFTTIREGNLLRIAEWPHELVPPGEGQSSRPDAIVAKKSVPRSVLLGAGFLLLAAVIGPLFFLGRIPSFSNSSERSGETSITSLTNAAFVHAAAISPDGKYFVYHENDGDTQRMYIQETGQSTRSAILTTTSQVLSHKTFAPDGLSIYYLASELGSPQVDLFRIPIIGGKPEKLLENIASPVSFSADGLQMIFLRKVTSVTIIVAADKDGHDERVLLRSDDQMGISYPALAPDGRSVAFWKTYTAASPFGQIFLLDTATGLVKPFSDEKWDAYYKIAWMPDGSGVVTIGSRFNDDTSTRRDEIYFVSYPEGRSHRITDDGYRHDIDSLGVTKDGAVLTVPDKLESQIWSMNADGDPSTATQITRGTVDGKAGLVSLPDHRIAYLTRVAGDLTIWIAKDDGSDARQLATGLHFIEELRADPAGRFLIFSTREDSGHHLFRINTDGSDMTQLTYGERSEIDSTISPDGETVVTDDVKFGDDDPSQKLLERLPSHGGKPEILPITDCEHPAYSPDGAMLSCTRNNAEVLVLRASDGHEIESYGLPPSSRVNIGVGWTPDSLGLIVMKREKYEQDKMLVIPRNGKPPFDFTTFPGDIIHRYAFSIDGKRLFVSRGYPMADAVLIKNFH